LGATVGGFWVADAELLVGAWGNGFFVTWVFPARRLEELVDAPLG